MRGFGVRAGSQELVDCWGSGGFNPPSRPLAGDHGFAVLPELHMFLRCQLF